jgi:hypothetical protein
MSRENLTCSSWPQLCLLVHQLLCERAVLNAGQTPLQWSLLFRHGRPCGALFWLQGPRQIQPSGIWIADEQRLLLYDSHGVRFEQLRLQPGPCLTELMTLHQDLGGMPQAA